MSAIHKIRFYLRHHIDGRTIREIARDLNLPYETVRTAVVVAAYRDKRLVWIPPERRCAVSGRLAARWRIALH